MLDLIPFSPSRLDATQFLIGEIRLLIKSKKDFLDVGCGKLFFYNLLLVLGARGTFTGIDLNPGKINKQTSKIKTKLIRANFLKFQASKKYDLVSCLWVLEHIKDDKKVFEKLRSLLNSKGFLILAIPSIWSWPFEFGRHGHHYYSKNLILKYLKISGLRVVKFYESAGLLGFVFMIIYNWPRFLVLMITLPIFLLVSASNIYKKSWKQFSNNLISNTLYRYHRSKSGINFHNRAVRSIVEIDKKIKILPASHIIIAKK